jgi:hypothetical protein
MLSMAPFNYCTGKFPIDSLVAYAAPEIAVLSPVPSWLAADCIRLFPFFPRIVSSGHRYGSIVEISDGFGRELIGHPKKLFAQR